ncbi:MAG TPA: hypothetical protein VGO47_05395 [Chlamydiales bacterium]|nr:hypothetical protein [Chlamydiales bacterium]
MTRSLPFVHPVERKSMMHMTDLADLKQLQRGESFQLRKIAVSILEAKRKYNNTAGCRTIV